jgi:hemolysin III
MHELVGLVSVSALLLLLLGGLAYSAGALVYAARWPNPLPRYFGFHEVFHLLVALGSLAMYTVVATEALGT